ncbi:MAG: UDP-N-acetylmuramoyl-tripeptide--D-alanyl-D-alanine ligase [Sedimentisphaerales bacterium]|nr:UDP-N-acetylmuramoyl-tripeptide--D-alanyl-D-alanine ligase [Sedimentisphaerales bacterium]
MKEISPTDLAKILNTGCEPRASSAEHRVRGVSIDSRTVRKSDCFFAIAGPNFDGHNFLADAFAKGASCAVVSKDVPADKFPDKSILRVKDTVESLGCLAVWYRRDCSFKVVAITGSVGKTTTRQITRHVLSKKFKTFQSLKNFNNFIGLPLSILAAPPDTQILVLELATSHPGEIEYLSKIAAPDIALITNVHPAHLAGFSCVEKIAQEKLAIAKCLSSNGTLIINADSPPLFAAAGQLNLSFKTFSLSPLADFPARNFILGPLAVAFTIDLTNITLPIPGRGALENTLAAWAICSTLGVSPDDFAAAVKTINPVSMRTEILQIGSLTVINDCYNANPASMRNAIEILSRLAVAQNRRSVFVCGDMAELGDSEQTLHIDLGRQIADAGVNVLITLGPLSELAALAAKQAKPSILTHSFAAPNNLCDNLHNLIQDSDIILVKGSRINKLETIVEKLKNLLS